ncbi:MAG: LacI family DNA-binding transcriptional regulator [Anaerolineaceae bacterium]|nr:LacI family DNA-binding transcriptional regulator [Anaerolineaceae bacterium]
MPITIKDIAKKAGVSHSTVSRALHGSPLINDETAGRIRQAAGELGYLPSAAARSLKTNRSQVLGVVVSSMDDPFFSEILQGIEDGVQESGYSLFIAAAQRDPMRERKIVQALMEHRADGVIICSSSFSAEQGRQLLQYGLPIVVVNNQAAEDFRYSIYHDDLDGSRQLTRHLIGLGHKQIAYLGNALSGRTSQDRLSGYCIEMEAAGLPIYPGFIHQVAGGDPKTGFSSLGHFLNLPCRPTALLCFNDMLAIGVLKGLHQAGIAVPQDFSVAGFDNIIFSEFTSPPLTTFDQPKQYIGSEAAHLILDLLKSPLEPGFPPQPKIRILQGSLLVRHSTAPPSSN